MGNFTVMSWEYSRVRFAGKIFMTKGNSSVKIISTQV